MPTARNFKRMAFQCGHYEAQDVLQEVDDVDLVHLESLPGYQFKESWQRRLLYRDVSRKLIFQNPGLQKVRLTREYDAFIAICQTHHDFLNINAIEGWKDHCKVSICLIDELWAAMLPQYRYWIHAFNRFDYVFVGFRGSVGPLSNAIHRPCHWLPGGVDALRFNPFPNLAHRVIDVYSIGRRREGIHQALYESAGRGEIFYVYDTIPGADRQVYDHREHRDLYANVAKRSRYFVVAPGKVDAQDETQGQVEIGYRYYEGSAAGTVMIGQPPDCDTFKEMFPWQDAVVEIAPDGSDVIEVLARLASDPDRVSAIRRRNAAEALLRHDWVYRWKEIFRVAGISPTPRLAARERRLRDLADVVTSSVEHQAASEALS